MLFRVGTADNADKEEEDRSDHRVTWSESGETAMLKLQNIDSYDSRLSSYLETYITLHYTTYITLLYVTLRCVTLHYISSNHITSHHITSHHITLHHITLHYITLHYTLHYNRYDDVCLIYISTCGMEKTTTTTTTTTMTTMMMTTIWLPNDDYDDDDDYTTTSCYIQVVATKHRRCII